MKPIGDRRGIAKAFDRTAIAQMCAEGKSVDEIASIIGCKSIGYLERIIKTEGLGADYKAIDSSKIRALHQAGWTILKIFEEFCGDVSLDDIQLAIEGKI